jgi:tRNA(fMet)-specific endonuclease VapC
VYAVLGPTPEVVRAYQNLLATVLYFHTITVLGFDEQTLVVFQSLRAQRVRIGTQDMRIAAITLRQGSILVTRNREDFMAVPSLQTEDWSLPRP